MGHISPITMVTFREACKWKHLGPAEHLLAWVHRGDPGADFYYRKRVCPRVV